MRAIFSNPSAWGDTIETLFYIPPTNKGSVIYGIAGANLSNLENSIPSPHAKGCIEDAQRSRFAGWSS